MTRPRRPVRFSMSGTMNFATFDEIAAMAKAIEELGFTSFYTSDHLYGVAGMKLETPAMEAWTIAAGLGAVTKRLRLGCLVSGVTYRHPAMLAKVTATVDQISHGRLELGIGAAWSKDDHIAYGLDFPSLKERQERLEEALAIIDSLWTQPSTTFIGKHYQVRDAVFEPKPVQKPRPPILIAAVGDRGIALTAKYAQIWASVSTPGFARQCIERIEAQCKAIDRDPREIEYSQYIGLMLSNDRRKVREAVEGRMKMLEAAARRPVMAQGRNALDGESAEARVRGSLLAGNGEEIREQVQRYVDVGVTHIILMTPRPFDRALVEKFRKGVMEGFIV